MLIVPYNPDQPPTRAPWVQDVIAAAPLVREAYQTLAPPFADWWKSTGRSQFTSQPTVRSTRPQYASQSRRMTTLTRYRAPQRRMTYKLARRVGRKSYPANRATVSVYNPRAEIKQHIHNPYASSAITSVGTIQRLTDIQQGLSIGNREGFVIKPMDIKIRGTIIHPGGVDPSQNVRIILVEWKQGYTAPAVSSILDNVPTLGYITAYSQEEARNYRVISDRTYSLDSHAGVAGGYAAERRPFKATIRVNREITYQGAGAGLGDISYWMLVVGELAVGTITASTATRFIDV